MCLGTVARVFDPFWSLWTVLEGPKNTVFRGVFTPSERVRAHTYIHLIAFTYASRLKTTFFRTRNASGARHDHVGYPKMTNSATRPSAPSPGLGPPPWHRWMSYAPVAHGAMGCMPYTPKGAYRCIPGITHHLGWCWASWSRVRKHPENHDFRLFRFCPFFGFLEKSRKWKKWPFSGFSKMSEIRSPFLHVGNT